MITIAQAYWDQNWQDVKIPIVINTADIHLLESFHRTLSAYLPQSKNMRCMELGCGSGAWLAYFHKNFGYTVSGVDYSQASVELCKKNLAFQGVEADIMCADLRSREFRERCAGGFDVVFSAGLVEHYHDPVEIMKIHLDLLRPQGIAVIEIPNFNFFNKAVARIGARIQSRDTLVDDFLQIHNLDFCTRGKFRKAVAALKDARPLSVDYCGLFALEHYNFSYNPDTLLRANKKMKRVIDSLRLNTLKIFTAPSLLFIGVKRTQRSRYEALH